MDAILGYCARPTIESGFVQCLTNALRDVERFDHNSIQIEGSPVLADLRNALVRRFLLWPADWLLMVDTDTLFTPADVEELFASADPDTRPIVSGLYRTLADRLACHYLRDGQLYEPATVDEMPLADRGGLCEVEATGAGFLLIHRSVFGRFDRWFDYIDDGTQIISEDVSFCMRARAADIRIFANTKVRVGHLKTQELVA